jgi:hypothetical protein
MFMKLISVIFAFIPLISPKLADLMLSNSAPGRAEHGTKYNLRPWFPYAVSWQWQRDFQPYDSSHRCHEFPA